MGSIPDKLDKIERDISGLSHKIDGLLAGFAGEIEMLELENYYTDIKDIVVVKCV